MEDNWLQLVCERFRNKRIARKTNNGSRTVLRQDNEGSFQPKLFLKAHFPQWENISIKVSKPALEL